MSAIKNFFKKRWIFAPKYFSSNIYVWLFPTIFLFYGCTKLYTENSYSIYPKGWKLVIGDINADWRNDRKDKYLSGKARLDEDQVDDTYVLLEDTHGKIAIFALVSTQSKRGYIKVFDGNSLPNYLDHGVDVGVESLPSGKYSTVCGLYIECSPSEKTEIEIKYESLLIFKEGSWSKICYWNSVEFECFNHGG